jgi:uncharacterized protein YjaZ
VEIMEIIVHDTITLLRPYFTVRTRPKELFTRVQATLLSPGGALEALWAAMKARSRGGFDVMEAAQHDGYEVLFGQQVWGLFNPTRKIEASAWEFEQYANVDILGRLNSWLQRFAAFFAHAGMPERIECYLLPADPANRAFMITTHGLSCFGGVPGYLATRVWPSPGNLARLGPALARVFAHNLRWANAPRIEPTTLGDFLVLEGLAAAFVAEIFPEQQAPWLVAFRAPDDWNAALQSVADMYAAPRYDDLLVNVYGTTAPVGAERPPRALPLNAEELEYARAVIGSALDISDARLIAAHLYGDELLAAQGHPTVGLPPFAGFEVGCRLVQAYLEHTGASLPETIGKASGEILARAGYGGWWS